MTAAEQPGPQEQADQITNRVNRYIQELVDTNKLDISPNARCKVCREPAVRELVNHMIARGYTSTDIYHSLAAYNRARPMKSRVSYGSVCNHRNEHFDIQSPANAILRQIAESTYEAQGKSLAEGVGTLVNYRSFLETLLVRSYETLSDPMVPVDIDLGFKTASKLAEIDRKDEGLLERAQMLSEMNRAVEVMRRFVPIEQWPALQAALRGEAELPPPPRSIGSARADAESDVVMVDIDDTPDPEEEHSH